MLHHHLPVHVHAATKTETVVGSTLHGLHQLMESLSTSGESLLCLVLGTVLDKDAVSCTPKRQNWTLRLSQEVFGYCVHTPSVNNKNILHTARKYYVRGLQMLCNEAFRRPRFPPYAAGR